MPKRTTTNTTRAKQRVGTTAPPPVNAAAQLATIAANMGIIKSPKLSQIRNLSQSELHTHTHKHVAPHPHVPTGVPSQLSHSDSEGSFDDNSSVCSSIYSDDDSDLQSQTSFDTCNNANCTHHHATHNHAHIYSQSPQPLSLPSGIPELDQQIRLFFDCCTRGVIDPALQLIPHIPLQALDDGLLISTEHNQLDIINILLTRVTSVNTCNSKGEHALIIASRFGHKDLCVHLLKNGATLEHKSNDGVTALYAAIEFNQLHVAELLITQHNANIHICDNQNNTLLHVAAHNGFSPIILLLFQYNISCNVLNDRDETPLEVAKNSETCRLLLEYHISHTYEHHHAHAHVHPPTSTSTTAAQPAAPTAATPHTHHQYDICPFRELPAGPASYLFWTAMGVGKDSFMFQNFGIYPFDRLNDTERIIVLTEIAEVMSGFKKNIQSNLLNESSLYAVFALMKARLKLELQYTDTIDEANGNDNIELNESHFVWRKRIVAAYEQVYNTSANTAGLSVECWKKNVWNTVINLLARSLFGEIFWLKKNIFLCSNILLRNQLIHNNAQLLSPQYNVYTLPNTSQIEIQLTFKKLITMSKTFLNESDKLGTGIGPDGQSQLNTINRSTTGCFCQDCISELEVPLTFKLQFLEEAAEEKRKFTQKNTASVGGHKSAKKKGGTGVKAIEPVNPDDDADNRAKLDIIIGQHRGELVEYWNSIKIEAKWQLTEMSTAELSNKITQSGGNWEVLRAALESYAKYAWEEDVLEISDDCITVADEMCDDGLVDMIDAILDSIELCKTDSIDTLNIIDCNDDEYDRKTRQMLENVVLAEFARKIAASYLLHKQENYAERIAAELGLELLAEEAMKDKAGGKGKKKNENKKNKQKQQNGQKAVAATKAVDTKASAVADNNDDTESSEETMEPVLPPEPVVSKPVVEAKLVVKPVDEVKPAAVKPAEPAPVKPQPKVEPIVEQKSEPTPPADEAVYEFVLDERPGAAFAASMLSKTAAAAATATQAAKAVKPVKPVAVNKRGSVSKPDQLHSQFIDSVFLLCTRETAAGSTEQQLKLLGLQRQHTKYIRNCRPKQTALFLLNTTDRILYGIYEANLITVDRSKHIEFSVIHEYAPLPYAEIESLVDDKQRIRRLDLSTTQAIIEKFVTLQTSKPLQPLITPPALTIPIAPINSILTLHPRITINTAVAAAAAQAVKSPATRAQRNSVVAPSDTKKGSVTTLTPIMTAPASVQAKFANTRQQRNGHSTTAAPATPSAVPTAIAAPVAAAPAQPAVPAPVQTPAAAAKPVQNVWKIRQEQQQATATTPSNTAPPAAVSKPAITILQPPQAVHQNASAASDYVTSPVHAMSVNASQFASPVHAHTPSASYAQPPSTQQSPQQYTIAKPTAFRPAPRESPQTAPADVSYNTVNAYNSMNAAPYNGVQQHHQPQRHDKQYDDAYDMQHLNHAIDTAIQPAQQHFKPAPTQYNAGYTNGHSDMYATSPQPPAQQYQQPNSYATGHQRPSMPPTPVNSQSHTYAPASKDIWGWGEQPQSSQISVRQGSANSGWSANESTHSGSNADIWSAPTISKQSSWTSTTASSPAPAYSTNFINPSIWSTDTAGGGSAPTNAFGNVNAAKLNSTAQSFTPQFNGVPAQPFNSHMNGALQQGSEQAGGYEQQQQQRTAAPVLDKKLLFTTNGSIW